jgi:U3 small nucleolar RNA-associated protein 5
MAPALLALGGARPAGGVAQVTQDNRVAWWDGVGGELRRALQAPGHLGARYTALALLAAGDDAGGGKQVKQSKRRASLAAVGDALGRVTVWDLGSGERLQTELAVPGASASAVSALCFSADGTKLYCGGAERKHVAELSVADGGVARSFKVGRQGCSRLAVSADGKLLLTGALEVRLWDLETGRKVKRFAGHATPVRALAFSPDARHFASCCEDRAVSLWSCEPAEAAGEPDSGKRRKSDGDAAKGDADGEDEAGTPLQRAPTCVLTARSPVQWVSLGERAGRLWVAAVCEDESGALWTVDSEQPENAAKPDCVLALEPGATGGLQALFLPLGAGGVEAADVVAVRSTPLRPVFQSLQVGSSSGALKTKVGLGDLQGRLATKGGAVAAAGARAGEQGEGEGDEGDEDQPAAGGAKAQVLKAAKSVVPAPKPASQEQPEDALDSEGTLGDRVRALSDKLGRHIDETPVDASAEAELAGKKRPRTDGETAKTAAVSLSTVLEQALQANDNTLMEVCLRNSDRKIISATVQRLSPTKVLPLLNIIVGKFESKPARGLSLLVWIKAVLDQHVAHLIKQPDLAESLSSLYRIIETRLGVFPRLLKLQGRLEFIVQQVAARNSRVAASNKRASKGPAVVYDEQAPMQLDDQEDSDEAAQDAEAAEENVEDEDEEGAQEEEQEEEEEEEQQHKRAPRLPDRVTVTNGKAHKNKRAKADESEEEEQQQQPKAKRGAKGPSRAAKRVSDDEEEVEDSNSEQDEEEKEKKPKAKAVANGKAAKAKPPPPKPASDEDDEEDQDQDEDAPKPPSRGQGKVKVARPAKQTRKARK